FIFGIIIVVVASRQGLETTGGAEGVGRATALSVAFSFLLIVLADLIINAFFYFL
ncbi:MAG: ABC transporter permease, partial [Candidatus Omnitrophica bacterium]|nr:ABC transporter permease [Candidatus Omnitrophota bacterium]